MLNRSHLEVISAATPTPPAPPFWRLISRLEPVIQHFALGIIQNEYIGLVLFCHGELVSYV